MKKSFVKLMVIIIISLLFIVGCTSQNANDETNLLADYIEEVTNTPKPRPNLPDVLYRDDYNLERINGNWYMSFEQEKADNKESHIYGQISATISYDSFDDLLDTIIENKFQKGELKHIQEVFRHDENGVILFDISNPPVVHYPDNYKIVRVIWAGSTYAYRFSSGEQQIVQLQYLNKEDYDYYFQNQYVKRFENPRLEIISTEKEGNKEITIYKNVTGYWGYIERSEIDGMIIERSFHYNEQAGRPFELPYQIQVYFKSEEVNYRLSINEPAHYFSDEELKQFNLSYEK